MANVTADVNKDPRTSKSEKTATRTFTPYPTVRVDYNLPLPEFYKKYVLPVVNDDVLMAIERSKIEKLRERHPFHKEPIEYMNRLDKIIRRYRKLALLKQRVEQIKSGG